MAADRKTTKEQERAELHRAIWSIAKDLRGSVDGWDFKQNTRHATQSVRYQVSGISQVLK